jgi:two-component system OmpR family response regulator
MAGELRRITCVEDEPDIRAVTELALRTIGGFTVDLCGSGEEALKRVPVFRPDLVLLDVMMAQMSGLDTFRALRTLPGCGSLPVVFMTAKAQLHEVQAYLAMGAADVISKPFDPIRLATIVRDIWQRVNNREDTPCRRSSGLSFENIV